ncbi:MAG TPA: DUF349 domain-containing protein [Luteibaculaceae bacterium]|nr:DUF349 domain-containing protein [Luteibaculaceae bacterium]
MKKEIIEKINALSAQELTKEITAEVKQLIADFTQQQELELKAQLEVFLSDPENDKNDFVPAVDPLEDEFRAAVEFYNQRRRHFAELRAAAERENLKTKEDVIAGISHITANEENISKAFAEFNAYLEKWKQTGRVPGDKHQEITSAYHAAVDNFYYHIRIYKDLKELDLKKNLELKKELLTKLEATAQKESVKEMEEAVRALQAEWYELGPVPKDQFDELRAQFTAVCDTIYAKIKTHFAQQKEIQQENLRKKQSILDKTVNIIQTKRESHKDWQKSTEKLIKLQEEWKTVGFGPKKENEEIWQEFRKQCDFFFAEKKKYYDSLGKEFEINRIRKEDLCDKVEAIQGNTNWKETADKIVKFQQQWKNIGSAGQKHEQKLWLRFRAACNAFFDLKKTHFASQDEKLAENLIKKEELLQRMEATVFGDSKEQNLELIKAFTKEWSALGHVPRKDMDRINSLYNKVLDNIFEKLQLDKEELEHSKFITRIQGLLGQEDYAFLLSKERKFLDDKIKELEHQVIQYENNLGFFANSKGADKMLKDVMINLNKAKSNIKRIEEQKKIMSKMMREKEKATAAQTE